jgi:CDP-diacylglycerol pyrophosphatase
MQFTVTNTENAEIQLFNILGQKVLQTHSTEENTVISTASFPQGVYVLKVIKDNISTVHKVVVEM